ncbi:hypothetical protein PISMIDRAFT_123968 [Pisolithus microcarpus 441]|uniref:Uncharacterized protein n=1 Tax=Pisolithus microcarpus 441 TaxID=765257 RepID=A0A0C9Y9P0_9AGAM|nr:hypothetical protein BKA83DRAFT_123968 [Pisolithus microcarpus]KIK10764.1 hypothetical protein PISMIDRAFT_123968 [Pisolithus microcarpus 441]
MFRAGILGIHRNTLHRCMKHHGVERRYSETTNAELDELVHQFKKKWPNSRILYLVGFMWRHAFAYSIAEWFSPSVG